MLDLKSETPSKLNHYGQSSIFLHHRRGGDCGVSLEHFNPDVIQINKEASEIDLPIFSTNADHLFSLISSHNRLFGTYVQQDLAEIDLS